MHDACAIERMCHLYGTWVMSSGSEYWRLQCAALAAMISYGPTLMSSVLHGFLLLVDHVPIVIFDRNTSPISVLLALFYIGVRGILLIPVLFIRCLFDHLKMKPTLTSDPSKKAEPPPTQSNVLSTHVRPL